MRSVDLASELQQRDFTAELDMVRFDSNAWQFHKKRRDSITWTNDAREKITLTYLPAPFRATDSPMSIAELRNLIRGEVQQQDGGILSIDLLQLNGLSIIETLYKVRYRSGFTFIGTLTVLCGDSTYIVRIVAPEVGTTGKREGVVIASLLSRGSLRADPVTNSWLNFAADPYDPSVKGSCLRNKADDEDYDRIFPDHPLTRTRKLLADIRSTMHFHPDLLKHARKTAREEQPFRAAKTNAKQTRRDKFRKSDRQILGVFLCAWMSCAVIGGTLFFVQHGTLSNAPPATLNDRTFAPSLAAEKHPVAVFFYRQVDPVASILMKKLSRINAQAHPWRVAACDLDKSPQLDKKYHPSSPSMVLYVQGKPVRKVTIKTDMTDEQVVKAVDSAVSSPR